jgi:magnesium-protoporphyrin O-methyltransferase
MHAVGQFFPRSDRSPAIVPVSERKLRDGIEATLGKDGWRVGRTRLIQRGFYTSQAMELIGP